MKEAVSIENYYELLHAHLQIRNRLAQSSCSPATGTISSSSIKKQTSGNRLID